MLWLMFLRLKVSVDAAKTATSVTPARMRALEAGEVGHERRVARARPSRDAGEHLLGVRHLRHPFRADERRDFDDGQAGGAQPVDELDLVGGRDGDALVLQAVARPDFDDGDVASGHSPRNGHSFATARPASSRLHELALAAVHRRHDARRPARESGSSIFIASSTTTVSPFLDRARPATEHL